MLNMSNLVNFDEVIKALNQGKRAARAGWNGKGLFIFKQVPAIISVSDVVPIMQSLPQTVKDEFIYRNAKDNASASHIRYENQMCLVYPDNTLYGYTPSTSDVLAEDWIILHSDHDIEPIHQNKDVLGVTFGLAIKMLKQGARISRAGWNASGMFLYYVPASCYEALTPIAKEAFGDKLVPYREYIAIKTAQGDVMPWSPSSSDVFENDWEFFTTEFTGESKNDAAPKDSTFEIRLLKEKEELSIKVQALTMFTLGDKIKSLGEKQQKLLKKQRLAMMEYEKCLIERLDDLGL